MKRESIVVATYNIHRWIGTDGGLIPDRVVGVICELKADLIGLQEVRSPIGGRTGLSLDGFLKNDQLQTILGPTLLDKDAVYGNALLTTLPVLSVHRFDLTVHPREPRGALEVVVALKGTALRVTVTHLGLRASERHRQVGRLMDILARNARTPVILMGDFNDWLPRSRLLKRLSRHLGFAPAPRTFPSRLPLFALDRIWVRPREALIDLRAHISPLARIASDHLPLKAKIVPGNITARVSGHKT